MTTIYCDDCKRPLFEEKIEDGKYKMENPKCDFRQIRPGVFLCLNCLDNRIKNKEAYAYAKREGYK